MSILLALAILLVTAALAVSAAGAIGRQVIDWVCDNGCDDD